MHLSRLGHSVTGWSKDQTEVDSINNSACHPSCFSDSVLTFSATTHLTLALESEYVIVALPTRVLAEYKELLTLGADQWIISAMKGFDPVSSLTPSQYLKQNHSRAKVAVISGPSFAIDVINQTPVAVTAATDSIEDSKVLAALFSSPSMRVYPSSDVIGVELGGALKNIIALASGIAAGLKLGDSTKAALITRGLAEMTRFAEHYGAHPKTLSGLSGLGDLVLTTSSHNSRNYRFGIRIGEGASPSQATKDVGSTAEGYFSCPVVYSLSTKHNIKMPICGALYQVLYEGVGAIDMISMLMSRPGSEEF